MLVAASAVKTLFLAWVINALISNSFKWLANNIVFKYAEAKVIIIFAYGSRYGDVGCFAWFLLIH